MPKYYVNFEGFGAVGLTVFSLQHVRLSSQNRTFENVLWKSIIKNSRMKWVCLTCCIQSFQWRCGKSRYQHSFNSRWFRISQKIKSVREVLEFVRTTSEVFRWVVAWFFFFRWSRNPPMRKSLFVWHFLLRTRKNYGKSLQNCFGFFLVRRRATAEQKWIFFSWRSWIEKRICPHSFIVPVVSLIHSSK